MVSKTPLHCAIYTRKSTEHGLELEFNSLDAQREACEAYIKSQAHEGWRALSQRYDDPAYSGGSLERPAVQQLLADIDAGRVNVVVVYKIDRLTRSLADFAKLVDIFDRKGISFVAVTQQFNTTTSMGRLTLNVLLSFAQFERELSSERVRDKVAASRRKGKWTGGSVPLGYDATDKKLTINSVEAETVRTIFRRHLDLKCLRLLGEDLDVRGIVTKHRIDGSGMQTRGGRFTYGPLAYLLKNRTYLGEMGHKGQWFPGEHGAIIDQATFDKVQSLMTANSVTRRQRRSNNGFLLAGLLYDDRGNRMTPSFSKKGEIRYRFYVSSALLNGKKRSPGTLPRISAPDLEAAVIAAVSDYINGVKPQADLARDRDALAALVDRIVVSRDRVRVTPHASAEIASDDVSCPAGPSDPAIEPRPERQIDIPWRPGPQAPIAQIDNSLASTDEPDPALVQAISRAHSWVNSLTNGEHTTIESLASSVNMNPKVIRKYICLAFLDPKITEAVLLGRQPKSLTVKALVKSASLSWAEQRNELAIAA